MADDISECRAKLAQSSLGCPVEGLTLRLRTAIAVMAVAARPSGARSAFPEQVVADQPGVKAIRLIELEVA